MEALMYELQYKEDLILLRFTFQW